MGRSRRRTHDARRAGTVGGDRARGSGAPPSGAAPRMSRSAQRDAEARAALRPLAEGERPGAVTVAAIVAVVLAALVVAGYATGARVGGERTSLPSALLLVAILLVAAWGMWNVRYWAVLGFQALLVFQLIVAALSLMVAANVWAAVLCVSIIALGGVLFWKLIRAMARIQMPRRPERR